MQDFSWLHPVHLTLGMALLMLTAGGWFTYFHLKDEGTREARWLRIAAIAGGCASIGAALFGYRAAESLGLRASWQEMVTGGTWPAMRMALLIGTVEEAAKLLPVAAFCLILRPSSSARTGLILAACSGVGFATAESAILMSSDALGLAEGLARAAATPVTHALFAAPWGLGLMSSLRGEPGRGWSLAAGFATSVASHGLYDFLLSRPGLPPAAAALVVLSLWVWLMAQTRPTPRRHPRLISRRENAAL
ncbi:MAG TPA: PrsW family glutamic-type intramembrane protease [Myxococcaceae bacterium]|nr:PrsW family glutamic-type intramembrane protease [Myxococcaceae bacterium]